MNTLTDIQTASDDDRWTAVVGRDPHFDGRFVYAVATTGIYCRPSCPSRRPGRQNVSFYALPEAAEQGAFAPAGGASRANAATDDPTIATVRAACRFIETQEEGPPTLEAIADHVGASPFHLQRTFKRIMGISPRQYADAVRLARFRTASRTAATSPTLSTKPDTAPRAALRASRAQPRHDAGDLRQGRGRRPYSLCGCRLFPGPHPGRGDRDRYLLSRLR